MPTLRIHLLGSVRVESLGVPVPERLTRVLQGLLAFLVLNRRRTHSRDALLGTFWGDQPLGSARRCLNTAIWRLRQVLEPAGGPRGSLIVTDPDGSIGLNLDAEAWIDVACCEDAARRLGADGDRIDDLAELDRLRAVLVEPPGDLLEGFYEDWALEARERFRSQRLVALTALARAYRRLGQAARCVEAAELILAQDPFREDALRELMRAAAHENRPLALQRYAELKRRLRSELGVAPMAETTAVYRDLRPDAEPADPGGHPDAIAPAVRELKRMRRRLTALIARLETRALPPSPLDPR